jgi:surfactin synthase thioesterase subunit
VNDRDLEAWRSQTDSSFSLRILDGDHFFLNQPPLLRALSHELEGSWRTNV